MNQSFLHSVQRTELKTYLVFDSIDCLDKKKKEELVKRANKTKYEESLLVGTSVMSGTV